MDVEPGLEVVPLSASEDVRRRFEATMTAASLLDSPPTLDSDVIIADQILKVSRSAGLDVPPLVVDFAIDELDAERLLDREPRPMSRGERQICGLLITLAAPFDRLYTIDPTAGLDATRRRVVVELLTDLAIDHQIVCASDDPLWRARPNPI